MSLKNPMTPPGIDPGTVLLVAQRLDHCSTPGPSKHVGLYIIQRDTVVRYTVVRHTVARHTVVIHTVVRHTVVILIVRLLVVIKTVFVTNSFYMRRLCGLDEGCWAWDQLRHISFIHSLGLHSVTI
jgi:hypothetical protein